MLLFSENVGKRQKTRDRSYERITRMNLWVVELNLIVRSDEYVHMRNLQDLLIIFLLVDSCKNGIRTCKYFYERCSDYIWA